MEISYYKWNPEGNFDQWLEENMEKSKLAAVKRIYTEIIAKGICRGAHAFLFFII